MIGAIGAETVYTDRSLGNPSRSDRNPMKLKHVEFVKSALKPEDLPRDGRPEIAFVGRSNVGKSSLLNTILARKGLAKTSGTPASLWTYRAMALPRCRWR
jgi:ribosome biogenesis GTPase A